VAESLTPTADGWVLPDPAATAAFGAVLARAIVATPSPVLVLHLEGDLGAGKTSLVRGLLAGLGHTGRVPSPTYTLVEPYQLGRFRVLHVDLYRLRDPAELEDLGLRDELTAGAEGTTGLLLAEWPARGGDRLPAADMVVAMAVAGTGRTIRLEPRSPAGGVLRDEVRRALAGGS
jgi:tRNA threonylcarbamoyladenosine biosynthesis protein TsaE